VSNECSKAIPRRVAAKVFASHYFVGDGIDIGSGSPTLGNVDFLGNQKAAFPLMRSCRSWDIEDGDAENLAGIPDASFDFVHSSHTLEHMHNPGRALRNWFRVLRPGGYLVAMVPDEDLYEHGFWPSRFNGDHKWSFTIKKIVSPMPRSLNLDDLLLVHMPLGSTLVKLELLHGTFDPTLAREVDQTGGPAECAIEVVVRKA
jgi:SAM-dependent methyltransferase